jgi:hypothetical protein
MKSSSQEKASIFFFFPSEELIMFLPQKPLPAFHCNVSLTFVLAIFERGRVLNIEACIFIKEKKKRRV